MKQKEVAILAPQIIQWERTGDLPRKVPTESSAVAVVRRKMSARCEGVSGSSILKAERTRIGEGWRFDRRNGSLRDITLSKIL